MINVSAVNCQSGDNLAQEQVTANGKENVLKALGEASTKIREKLGESLKTVQKLDTPIEEATTPSWKRCRRTPLDGKRFRTTQILLLRCHCLSAPFELDPNFAMAYATLGTTYHNLGEKIMAADDTEKRTSGGSMSVSGKNFISNRTTITSLQGIWKKRGNRMSFGAQIYPREQVPTNLGTIYQVARAIRQITGRIY